MNIRSSLMAAGQVSHPRDAMNNITVVLQHKCFYMRTDARIPRAEAPVTMTAVLPLITDRYCKI
jgi:hypothetical protein